jgi:hypothetical protein
MSQPTLTIAFPAKFQIHARFAMTLIEVVERLREIQSDWKIRTHYILGKSNLSHARSVLVTEWYEGAADNDGFFFIDTDHTFTAEDILRVVRQDGDLNAGVYCNRGKDPTCFPEGGVWPDQVDNIPLKFAATGFLFFRKSALVRIHEWMKNHEKLNRVTISDYPGHVEQRTIPFFHSIMEPPKPDGKVFWLGEDFSFSWRAIQAGLKIRGCITYTLGHEIPYVVFNDKPRRGPRMWLPTVFVVYAGNLVVSETEVEDVCKVALDRANSIVVFSGNRTGFRNPRLHHKRYEEFNPQDQFGTLFLWGTENFGNLAQTPQIKELFVYIEKRIDSLPMNLLQAKQVFVPTIELYSHYLQLFKTPNQLLLGRPGECGSQIQFV